VLPDGKRADLSIKELDLHTIELLAAIIWSISASNSKMETQ
jgi:hypothetical protein